MYLLFYEYETLIYERIDCVWLQLCAQEIVWT